MGAISLPNHEKMATFWGGATAGFCVDISVYPMDTIKTRLQSASHEIKLKSDGKFGLFAGLPAVLLGSAPAAALFFTTYEVIKKVTSLSGAPLWMSSMVSACVGDMVACIVRVPVETIKQRTQSQPHLNVRAIFAHAIKSEGFSGLYRGYVSQICRGFPFCLIQYPIWELLKRSLETRNRESLKPDQLAALDSSGSTTLSKKQFALCGAVAGAIGGTATTPMDVAKTRIMLAEKATPMASGKVSVALRIIYREGGVRGLFAGVLPRILIMSFGGAIFLGLYDITKSAYLGTVTPPRPTSFSSCA